MSKIQRVPHIHVVLKDGMEDVAGARVEKEALRQLSIETGAVKTGKVFSILFDLEEKQLHEFAHLGLKDSVTQEVFVNSLYNDPRFKTYLLVAKLPGVTDDEGVSAQKTLCDLFNMPFETTTQRIFTSELYLFEKELSDEALETLGEKLLANTLVQQLEFGPFTGTISTVPEVRIVADATTETVDLNISDEALLAISKERVLSLNLEEMRGIRDFYLSKEVIEARQRIGMPASPTDAELEMFGQTWSEHCSHKEFNATIHYENVETGETETIRSLFKTYIQGSTKVVSDRLEASGHNWLVKVFSDNAGVVRIDDDRVFVFKVETHNSPSALDPYGGAITGILGNNRDPLGTGRGGGRLLFNTNVLCFGSPYYSKPLLTGQLHPARIFEGVRHGIEDGGNKSGIPTVNGAIVFDDRYAGKPLVYCGTGGIMPSSYQGKDSWVKEIDAGDRIVMGGGRVGKDGIHGATFSSVEIDKHSPKSAVQIGSPITQKLLADFMEQATAEGLIKCTTDNGAGGLSSSVGELATICDGAEVHLEKVPLKYSGLKPWEIFVSESQERMTYVVEPHKMDALMELAAAREVELTDIGHFTDDGYLNVFYDGVRVIHLPMGFLHNGAPGKTMEARYEPPTLSEPDPIDVSDHGDILLKLLESENICSRERVIRQYDHEVKGKTVVKPLMGASGKAPQDAAVMRLGFDSYVGVAISNGIVPRYGDIDAYEMSAGAFDEAVRQIISVGGKLPDVKNPGNRFWSVNDNFCLPDSAYDPVGNPDGKEKLAQLVRICRGLYDMATTFNIPMTSGKDSMKNDFRRDGVKISVPPTILYSMVARLDDVRKVVTSDYKVAGDVVYLVGTTYDELGASEFYRLHSVLGANVPKVRRDKALARYHRMEEAHDGSLIQSSHDLSDGGLAVTMAESAFGGMLGCSLNLPDDDLSTQAWLYSESHSRFLVTTKPEDAEAFEGVMGADCTRLGVVTDDSKVVVTRQGKTLIDVDVARLLDAWSMGLEK